MRFNYLKATFKTAVLAVTILLLGVGVSLGQQVVNLTAGPSSIALPDGSTVPMWGYSCGTIAANCAPLNPVAATTTAIWSPVVITVPTGQTLQINLTNNLAFSGASLPTSLVIVGQLGAGLGTTATSTPSPDHTHAQQVTWPIANPGTDVGKPPAQGNRVQSFSTEVAPGGTTSLTWSSLRPGTYLLESGTHPSIQGPMGLFGLVVVTTVPATGVAGTAYGTGTTAINYNAEIPLLFSEIDPVQNSTVQAAVNTAGFSETKVWSGQPGGCGNPASGVGVYLTCYPPAVNYTPLYYLINGIAFDKTHAAASVFPTAPATGLTATTQNILVRLVNAGLRMHVPSIVGAQTGASGVSGFSLIAEDGNPLPGVPRVQSEVFMAAGKTYDVMMNVPTGTTPLPIFDRELSLSGNATARDAGMLAYIGVNGAALPSALTGAGAVANPDIYNSLTPCAATPCPAFTVSDPGKGVIANDVNVFGVQVLQGPTHGTLTLNANGTFSYAPSAAGTTPDSFVYCANGSITATGCSSGITALVTLGAATIEASTHIHLVNDAYTSNVATSLSIKPPGVLANDYDDAGYPLKAVLGTATNLSVALNADGSFTATPSGAGVACAAGAPAGSQCYTFSYSATNSQGTPSGSTATATLTFLPASNLAVTVLDGVDKSAVTDYRWIIEEDRTFYLDPGCTSNPPDPATCPAALKLGGIVPTFGTNFHTSYMPLVATGCTGPLSCEGGQTIVDPSTGNHVNAVCDLGNGVCRPDTSSTTLGGGNGFTQTLPASVYLDPTKRYYISVLPGDAANPFINAETSAACMGGAVAGGAAGASCGHGMGGAPIAANQKAVTVISEPAPYQTAKLSVFVFEDDFPLNGENDAGGGIDTLSPNEPGLGGFNITLFDDAGGTGDATGQMTYDMFNMPLSNSLSGTIDPLTGLDACPVSKGALQTGPDSNPTASLTGITSTIVTCPEFESDGITHSPLRGQVVVANLMPGRYGVVATPAADRIGRGEEWLQTNTLDGQKAHDSFLRIGEPSFFQEFGPAGYHVSIGFANPAIINSRLAGVCAGTDPNITGSSCTNTVSGRVTTERMSRTPDERLYSSGSNDSFAFTQCYVSFGDADGEDFAFTKCNSDGTFSIPGLPDGDWRITVFDQWNDMLVDGLSTPVRLDHTKANSGNMGDIAMNQWQANIYTSTFFDANKNGVRDSNESGLTLVATNIRFRDGSYSNFNNTDLSGNAGFNEVFPLFSWYVIETDTTRYKSTGIHVVYDAGGPADGTCAGAIPPTAPCGNSGIAHFMANTAEQVPLPANLRVPGGFYCATADCADAPVPLARGGNGGSTGRVDPPLWFGTEGWQGFSGQNGFLEFGKAPFVVGENGGIHGEVIYASTRPFDDPALLIHTSWTPDVPGVTINLYQEGTAPDGSVSLKLVDTTKTSSWDDWAQGFRSDGIPNMNCPGQGRNTGTASDLFFFSLFNQPMWLDEYNSVLHGTGSARALPANSQFKCYDGMHNWNQLQPAPYDGMYAFPSVTSLDPTTGKPAGTNCTICTNNPDATDPYRHNTPMLPAGKYVVEMIVPPGYELVKEEDKNILIGDNYVAPVTQQFAGLGNIFILPDQAEVGAAYNANSAQNPTQALGRSTFPSSEGDTGSVEVFWPCVGASRIVPDYISLFPGSHEVSPFAGATRNLCDRKEVALTDQTAALAKFWIFTSAHAAAHYTGVITDDFTSEFDPFSPQFGEKFSPPDLPISIKDFNGNEISRTYADHWGTYNGLNYSTWEVNPPNPTGYAPTMMVVCMNDPGPIPGPSGTMITDPLYNPQYSQFCYEIPFMPGQTQYMDTPVTPTSAFAGAGYNNPDCAYPDATPAVSEVDGDGIGPWVSAANSTLTIHALGDQMVNNYGYAGPQATAPPYNRKKVLRHYGFGASGTVTIGGVPATVTGWSDTQITVTVPSNVPNCNIQQQTQYGGSAAQCGQLVITTGSGNRSIDAVTVTIGGKAPAHVAASASIQSAIDTAAPGDLIIVDPTCATTAGAVVPCTDPTGTVHTTGAHNEMLLMWKPVRLQGVGAASSIINANTHPAGKMDVWRRQVNCLFGLALDGAPYTGNGPQGGSNPFDSTGTFSCPGTGWNYFVGAVGSNSAGASPQIDRLPLEATIGWDASLNGNLAELLQEPSLMGALEGAGITVLAKGVDFHGQDPFAASLLAGFPTGTTLLIGTPNATGTFPVGDANPLCHTAGNGTNPFPSNFQCNPSRIDGLTVTDSSQGGGGIFVHGWGHNLEISNNRVQSNSGTLSGGINVGQGEFVPSYLQGSATNVPPGSCLNDPTLAANVQLPYCEDMNVNVHNNSITSNASNGDELFSATPAGAGGVSFCTGSDYYQFNNNWVCGNLSTGDGGGVGHLGFIYHGDIEHNAVLFNQSTNPTIATNGGGILVMGTPDVDPPCGTTTDADCLPADLSTISPSDGAGPGLSINANLIMGNAAESGSGGGLRLQNVNGSEVVAFPKTPAQWYSINVTNNIIANNVAGWDGAGISLVDALNTNIINNTIVSNDTTASSGVLFNTVGAPLASSHGPCPGNQNPSPATPCVTSSTPQPAGLVSIQNSAVLTANLPANVTVVCPPGHYGGNSATNGSCRRYSTPVLENNVLWQNRAFYIGVGGRGASVQNQQNIVTLFNAFTTTRAASQPITGACVTGSRYWDIGVRGDTGPTNHTGGVLTPRWSVLTSLSGGYGNPNLFNTASNPTVVSQYCNGSRIPPEVGGLGWQVPPGISDATVPNPIFNLTPAATVDEGNNWVNIAWGPLSLTNPSTGAALGNYALAASSPAVDYVVCTTTVGGCQAQNENGQAPLTDFFGNPRPDPAVAGRIDVGAIEYQNSRGVTPTPTLTSITPNSGLRGTVVPVVLSGSNLTGATAVTVSGGGIGVTITSVNTNTVTANFTISGGAATTARNVSVTTPAGVSNNVTFTVLGPTLTSITPNTGVRGTPVNVTLSGSNLTGATAVNVSGGGITVSNFIAVDANTVTATFTISATATASARNVTVSTPSGATNALTFTVQGPTLTSITPNTGARGTAVNVTLGGTNLTGASAVTVAGSGVAVSNIVVVNSTTITATFTISPTAAGLLPRNVSVTTPIGVATLSGGFVVVNPPAPTLASINPTSAPRPASGSTAVPVVLTGTNFTAAGTTVAVPGGGVTVTGVSVNATGTQINATFNISSSAARTARSVTVTTPGGTSGAVTFTVN